MKETDFFFFLAAPVIVAAIGRAGIMEAPASVSGSQWRAGAGGGRGFILHFWDKPAKYRSTMLLPGAPGSL